MPEAWIEISRGDGARRRHTLKPGLTTLGGRRGDIELEGSEADQLHFWDQPPKVVFVGGDAPPLVNGRACDESALRPGDVVEWRGARIEFGGLPHAVIEEIAVAPPATAPALGAASAPLVDPADEVLARRLKAGLLVELGLSEPFSARRWQEAVVRNEFDPDACARDVLTATRVPPNDGRLLERSARLLRDLVMSPVQLARGGPTKKARSLAKTGLAAAIVQFLVFGICCLLVFVALFVFRWKWDWSVDAFLDRIGGALTGS